MSLRSGVSAFLISAIFIGFDPENLALGGVASYEGVAGDRPNLGSVIGAAMVATALAFGITAVLAPMHSQSSNSGVDTGALNDVPSSTRKGFNVK